MSFKQLLEEFDFNISIGSVVDAEVVDLTRNQVVVSVGIKGESAIPKSEFSNPAELKIGDTVPVLVENLDDGAGAFGLSHVKAKNINNWLEINKATKDNLDITVKVTRSTRGGLIVDFKGIQGFLPSSLVDVSTFTDASQFVGQDVKVRVIKFNEESNDLLVSRKAALLPDQETHDQIFNRLKVGDKVNGTVKNITDYGVFVDLGAVDGLLHITDVDWKRVTEIRKLFTIGQKIDLVVSSIDKNNSKISLSKKLLDKSPWNNFVENHKIGDSIEGVVVKTEDYGAFITIEGKIEGLVPRDELSWTEKNPNIYSHFEVGQKVNLSILEIEPEKHRITLSLKRNSENPYTNFDKANKEGDVVKGVVKSVQDFGIFVTLSGGLVGLVQTDEVSWVPSQHFKTSTVKFKSGDEVNVTVKKIDTQKEKIFLSLKERKEDPVIAYALTKKNEIVDAEIIDVGPRQIYVKINNDVYGIVKHGEAGLQYNDDLKKYFKVGEEVRAKVIGVKDRHIELSLKTL